MIHKNPIDSFSAVFGYIWFQNLTYHTYNSWKFWNFRWTQRSNFIITLLLTSAEMSKMKKWNIFTRKLFNFCAKIQFLLQNVHLIFCAKIQIFQISYKKIFPIFGSLSAFQILLKDLFNFLRKKRIRFTWFFPKMLKKGEHSPKLLENIFRNFGHDMTCPFSLLSFAFVIEVSLISLYFK